MSDDRSKSSGSYMKKFNIMLEVLAAPDGGEWTGTKMERATDGRVRTTYFASLRDGHTRIPGADKLEYIAEAMGFPVQLWFRSVEWWEELLGRWKDGEDVKPALAGQESNVGEKSLGGLLNRLFELKINDDTGESFTNAEVSEKSGGVLSVGDVEALREDRLADPTWRQILALSDVFEVEPSYWSRHRIPWRPSPGLMRAAEGEESYIIFQNSMRLSRRDRSMLRVMSEHLKRERKEDTGG